MSEPTSGRVSSALPGELWNTAIDPGCLAGVVRVDGQPFPLVEFMEDDDA